MRTITQRYLAVAANADFLSKLAALVVLVIAIVEILRAGLAVRMAENVNPDAVWMAFTTPIIYIAGYGFRFLWLLLGRGGVGRVLTWWAAVGAIYLDVELTGGPATGAMYSLFASFPLLVSGMIFVALGSIKFLVTVLFVLVTNHGERTSS
jgi:hypothetical protein